MDENMENSTPTPEENQSQPESAPPQPEATQAAPETAPVNSDISQDSKNIGMLCHLLGLFTNFVGPLILWLIKKDDDKFVDDQGKEALNFQITVAIAYFVGGLLTMLCIGVVILAAVGICDLVFCILACVAASKGQAYRYPLCIRLVK